MELGFLTGTSQDYIKLILTLPINSLTLKLLTNGMKDVLKDNKDLAKNFYNIIPMFPTILIPTKFITIPTLTDRDNNKIDREIC